MIDTSNNRDFQISNLFRETTRREHRSRTFDRKIARGKIDTHKAKLFTPKFHRAYFLDINFLPNDRAHLSAWISLSSLPRENRIRTKMDYGRRKNREGELWRDRFIDRFESPTGGKLLMRF